MDPPPVHYTSTPDGYRIAYTICGSGRPLVLMPIEFNHVQLSWRFATWFEPLAARFRLVQFDARGQGMSQRGLLNSHKFSDYELDLQAVIDAIGLREFFILGLGRLGHVAINYAYKHPERVTALVLNKVSVAMSSWPQALWSDLANENWDLFVNSVVPPHYAPAERMLFLQYLREAVTESDWQISARQSRTSDIETVLPQIRIPVLVIHHSPSLILTADQSADLASRLPDARFVLIGGPEPFGDAAQGIAAIEAFLADVLPERIEPRTLRINLSAREVQVLRLLVAGKSNQQIANELFISRNTVLRHVNHIFDKIGATNRVEATSYAYRNRIV